MYPEVRKAAAADTTPDFTAPGFDIDDYRRRVRAFNATQPREDVAEVTEVDADGVRCLVYEPEDSRPGTVLHLHGGGFVFNDIDVHDGLARRLANRSRRRVVSIGYRRPPEHRFPAAPDDADTVVEWARRQGWEGGLAVHGDSAGGNLALVAALRNPDVFDAVALVYPFLDPTAGFDSYALGDEQGLSRAEAAWYWQQYSATPADLDNPDLAPLRSDRLATLPPTLVATAEFDPLRDEGEELARRLAEGGVVTVGIRCLGQTHGFYRHRVFTASEPLVRQVAGFIDQHLS
jgi:acetyl esterase